MRSIEIAAPSQYQGLAEKIRLIRDYYVASMKQASVRRFAEKSSVGDMGPSINVLFTRLRSHVKYIPDHVDAELIKSPGVMVDEINAQGWSGGDCDDFASLSYTLLRSVGIPAELAVVWYDNEASPRHILAVVPMKNGEKIPFDLVAPQLGVTQKNVTKVAYYV